MSNLSAISITHQFNGDITAGDSVSAAQLDTQLGNLAANDNAIKAALDHITDGANNIAAQSIGKAQLKSDVALSLDEYSLAVIQKTILPAHRLVAVAIVTPSGTPTIDGVLTVAGNLVLLTAQPVTADNGSYTVSAGTWAKNSVGYPAVVQIDAGTTYQGSMWSVAADGITWNRITASYVSQLAAHIAAAGTAVHGLGNSAALNVGAGASTVCAGDDSRLSNARTPSTHAPSHQAGSSDPLTGLLDANARVEVDVGAVIRGTRRKINFISGADASVTAVDNPGTESVDVTINAIFPSAISNDILSRLNNTVVSLGIATLLPASSFGKMHSIEPTIGTYVITLPTVTGNARKIIGFQFPPPAFATYFITIQAQFGEKIDDTTRTSIKMLPGNQLVFQVDGTGTRWILVVKKVDTEWMDLSTSTTITATTTNPTKGTISRDKTFWRRRGDCLEIRTEFYQSTAGSAGTGAYLINLPTGSGFSGETIDSTKTYFETALGRPTGGAGNLGSINISTNGANYTGWVSAYDASRLRANVVGNAADDAWGSTLLPLSTTPLQVGMRCSLPMTGW